LGALGDKLLHPLKAHAAAKQTAHPHRSTCGSVMQCGVCGEWAKLISIDVN
jgi:hypothetical protein